MTGGTTSHEAEYPSRNGPDKGLTVVLYSTTDGDAMSMLRILGPADASEMKVLRGVQAGQAHPERVAEADIVVLQRDFPRDLDNYEKIIRLAADLHKPVVMDMDDLLFELPADHPDRITHEFTESLLPMLQAVMEADLVTVTTPTLRDYLLPFNENIKIIPNYLNDYLWSLRQPVGDEAGERTVTIGYMGGHSHRPDLLYVQPALQNILDKYRPRVSFRFWGIEAPPGLAEFSQVDWYPPRSYLYQDFADYFLTQAVDILIAPLVDTLFNRCKSSVKYFEYTALGAPGVFSRLPPYEQVITQGVNGFLAGTLEEWEQSLSRLVEDQALRHAIAVNAQDEVRSHWLLSQHAGELKMTYASAIREYSGQPRRMPPFYSALKSFTHQVYEGTPSILQQKERIRSLSAQLEASVYHATQLSEQNTQLAEHNAQLSRQVDEYEKEIVDYVTSTSWRVTRPLRKITGRLKGKK